MADTLTSPMEQAAPPDADAVEVDPTASVESDTPMAPAASGTLAGGSDPADSDAAPGGMPGSDAETKREPEEAPRLVIRDPIAIPDSAPVFERPEQIRGIYLTAWAAGSRTRLGQLIELAERTEINTFVIDVKDASGFVSWSSRVPEARTSMAVGQVRISDPAALIRRLHDAGIWPVARIVVTKDPMAAAAFPEWAIADTLGAPFVDRKGFSWLDLRVPEVTGYHLELAREAVALGFPEVQWDYIRWPDGAASDLARARIAKGEVDRVAAVRDFLRTTRDSLAALGTEVTADVFGVTTSAPHDVGIGQLWEGFIDVVDVALPMVYPSHYWEGSFGIEEPNAYPYEVVRGALRDALERSALVSGAGEIRPWLQDFSLGSPVYGAAEVRAQIEATQDVGIEGWILWNPASRYTEEALTPSAGWADSKPLIRVGGRIVPASERFEALVPIEPLVLPGEETSGKESPGAGEGEAEGEGSDGDPDAGVDPGRDG